MTEGEWGAGLAARQKAHTCASHLLGATSVLRSRRHFVVPTNCNAVLVCSTKKLHDKITLPQSRTLHDTMGKKRKSDKVATTSVSSDMSSGKMIAGLDPTLDSLFSSSVST